MLMASLSAAAVTCAGSEAEVPVHFVGWAEADAAWLEQELTGWVAAHERRLCAGHEGQGLSLEAGETEVTIHFDEDRLKKGVMQYFPPRVKSGSRDGTPKTPPKQPGK